MVIPFSFFLFFTLTLKNFILVGTTIKFCNLNFAFSFYYFLLFYSILLFPLVHFQNSATLIQKFIENRVQSYRVSIYPDSDHSITYGKSNRAVYSLLRDFLFESFNIIK